MCYECSEMLELDFGRWEFVALEIVRLGVPDWRNNMNKNTRQESVGYALGTVETLVVGLLWLEHKVHVGRKVGFGAFILKICVLSEQGG